MPNWEEIIRRNSEENQKGRDKFTQSSRELVSAFMTGDLDEFIDKLDAEIREVPGESGETEDVDSVERSGELAGEPPRTTEEPGS